MTDNERILKLRKTASDLGIRIHLASMSFQKGELDQTIPRDVFGIVFIDDVVSNETAFYLQQHRYDDGRAE